MRRKPTIHELEPEYRDYLSEVRALRPISINRLVGIFRRFRNFLVTKRVRSARRISLDLVYEFLERCCRGLARSGAGSIENGVRSFLKFLHFARILPRDLTKGMIMPWAWSLSDVPDSFSDSELATMFAELRSDTRHDLRERAVVTLFICYGLRHNEVRLLKTGDVDFRAKRITVRERKNRVPLVLPLLPLAEEAIRDYLDRARPARSDSKRLIIALNRGHGPTLSRQMVWNILKGFLKRCGIDGSARKFRHTLATRLIPGASAPDQRRTPDPKGQTNVGR